jgi:quercetin dioxygenase-like cupin family protein
VNTISSLVAVGALLFACAPAETPAPLLPATPPPALSAPSPAIAAPAASQSAAAQALLLAPPVMAKLVDVTATGAKVPIGSRCDVIYVAVAKGVVVVAGQSLAAGDVLMASSLAATGDLEMKGQGLAVTVTALHDCPTGRLPSAGPMAIKVARAGDAKDLAWAGGAMHAHLDLEKEVSPDVYVGRIEGTAPVAEHDHASSWEVLCAIEASGTFTLDGVARHIAGPQVIAVPPGRKHSWQPDPGSKLVAVQVYAPPGPEQRFKTLAGR